MPTILIIDDHAPVRALLKELFSANDYKVLEAGDGQKGLELFEKHRPEIVITDLVMPNKDGTEVIFKIKRERPETKVIAISGEGAEPGDYLQSIDKCVTLDHSFTKPFELNDMLEIVNKLAGAGD